MSIHSLPKPLVGALDSLFAGGSGKTGEGLSDFRTVGGGCINNAGVLTLDDGRHYFLKWNATPLPQLFEREAEGLKALHDAGAIRVPKPIATKSTIYSAEEISVTADLNLHSDAPPFLVLENIEVGQPGPGFFEEFGARFAELHRATPQDRCGFENNNYLGSTPQPNSWHDNWTEFFCENRLNYQFKLARQNGVGGEKLQKLGAKLMGRLAEWLDEPSESACLLHGDLWGGNYLASSSGDPVLIDPAAYYGRREADLAMTKLFGGFSSEFYAAYNEVWSLAEGSEERIEIYKLYHLLNHLNLFGGSYQSGCMNILNRLVG